MPSNKGETDVSGHTNVINILGKKLFYNTKSLLSKGLSFISTPRIKEEGEELLKDVERFESIYINEWLKRVPHRTRLLLEKTMTNIKIDLYGCSPLQVVPYLSRHERKALNQLIKDKSLIISKADKGDAVVLLVSTAYIELAYEHLRDNETYQLLQHDPTEEMITQFIEYLRSCREKGVISPHEYV